MHEANLTYILRARGVVVSHPLSMREALGSIPSVSISLASLQRADQVMQRLQRFRAVLSAALVWCFLMSASVARRVSRGVF